MIYESAVVLRSGLSEDQVKKIKEGLVEKVIKDFKGEVLLFDDWGDRTFAQPTSSGKNRGHYLYFMYKVDPKANAELERRFNITEEVMNSMIVKLGEESDQEKFVKKYLNPFKQNEDEDSGYGDLAKDRRMFSKKKSCWFSARKTEPDWKDVQSYSWLVNEFGKISPSRVSGISARYQRMATTAIKRGRNIGLLSYLSNRTAY